jgi:hypothetical protein
MPELWKVGDAVAFAVVVVVTAAAGARVDPAGVEAASGDGALEAACAVDAELEDEPPLEEPQPGPDATTQRKTTTAALRRTPATYHPPGDISATPLWERTDFS